jgi:hypothetical protein
VPEILWHYAVILEAVGEKERSGKALAKAIELNPKFKSAPDVLALQKKLSGQ